VKEITKDGRSIRISPDGKYAAYESGTRNAPVIRIFFMANPDRTAAEVRGTNLVFSPASNAAAFLRVSEAAEIAKLRKDIEQLAAQPSSDRSSLRNKRQQLARLEAENASIIFFDIVSKKEKLIKTEGLLKAALAFSADGHKIYFVGAKETDAASSEIYAVSPSELPKPLTSGPGFKINPMAEARGKYLIYAISTQAPFPKPSAAEPAARKGSGVSPSEAAAGGGQTARPAGAASEAQFRPASSKQFTILNLADKTVKTFAGSGPAVSADGSTIVYINQEGNDSTLNLIKLEGSLTPVILKKTAERIESAAPAADGSGVVFDMTYTRNGEIFYIKNDGKIEARLSREIENDRAPRFLNSSQVLAVKGEPRHSRAYIYDLKTLSNFRVFHNNTLRTIAPEYEWAANPSGAGLLIGAERDGDTISPERGVYLVDLTQKISMEELLARIRDNLAAEKALRAKGEKTFQPVRDAVKAAVDRVSITKTYEYEERLFNFDSKFITMPGNKLAGEYIFDMLKSFGYEPEYQWFDAKLETRGETRVVRSANILARLPGTENPDIIYVVSGHYDSNPRGPGADDNSSATAVLLETARVLAKTPLPSTVLFAAFTGEEAGLLGSREFVKQAKEKKWLIAADLNNDMIGWTNDYRLDNTIRYSNAGIRDIQHAAAYLFSKMVTYDARYVKATDAVSFFEAFGDIVGGLGSYPVLANPYYHQATDLLETINHELLAEAAKFNIASIMMLASSPAPVKEIKITGLKDRAADVSWMPSAEKAIAFYVVEYGPEKNPTAFSTTVAEPRARLEGFKLDRGEKLAVAVKAINGRGISSWDWTKTSVSLGK